jgi:hypothetical protein
MSAVQFVILDEAELVRFDGDDDELIHITCCNDDVALCGTDVSDAPVKGWDTYPDPDDCIVCEEIDNTTGCPECGL